jgi:Mechanosensitive ion channel
MGEMLRQIGLPVIEGMLALAAALSAVAFRRRTRMFTPAGFIMLALGLMLDLMAPHGMRAPEWTRYLRALAVRAWLQQRDLFSGLLIQSQRPFRPGDWVRFGEQVGRVQGTGWRATRIVTPAGETVTIPSGVLAKNVLKNYSATGRFAGEVFIGLDYRHSPGVIETIVRRLLDDIPEVLKEPPPEVSPWEYRASSLRYRIRYWLADYAHSSGDRAGKNYSQHVVRIASSFDRDPNAHGSASAAGNWHGDRTGHGEALDGGLAQG